MNTFYKIDFKSWKYAFASGLSLWRRRMHGNPLFLTGFNCVHFDLYSRGGFKVCGGVGRFIGYANCQQVCAWLFIAENFVHQIGLYPRSIILVTAILFVIANGFLLPIIEELYFATEIATVQGICAYNCDGTFFVISFLVAMAECKKNYRSFSVCVYGMEKTKCVFGNSRSLLVQSIWLHWNTYNGV